MASAENIIRGRRVSLRAASENDRRDIYTWLAASDVTPSMMGPPIYPEIPIPTWEEFCVDYSSDMFAGSRSNSGRCFIIGAESESVGHINYDGFDAHRSIAEIDIWMRSQRHCSRGYGTDALVTLMRFLRDELAVGTFVVRPSLRNQRAVSAYRKAGFRDSEMSREEQIRVFGHGDYGDTITLECKTFA